MKFFPEFNWLVTVPMLVAPSVLYVIVAVAASRACTAEINVVNAMRVRTRSALICRSNLDHLALFFRERERERERKRKRARRPLI